MDKKIKETLRELIEAKKKAHELNEQLIKSCLQYYEFEGLMMWVGWDRFIDDLWIEENEDPFSKFDKKIKDLIKKYYEE